MKFEDFGISMNKLYPSGYYAAVHVDSKGNIEVVESKAMSKFEFEQIRSSVNPPEGYVDVQENKG